MTGFSNVRSNIPCGSIQVDEIDYSSLNDGDHILIAIIPRRNTLSTPTVPPHLPTGFVVGFVYSDVQENLSTLFLPEFSPFSFPLLPFTMGKGLTRHKVVLLSIFSHFHRVQHSIAMQEHDEARKAELCAICPIRPGAVSLHAYSSVSFLRALPGQERCCNAETVGLMVRMPGVLLNMQGKTIYVASLWMAAA